MSILPRPEALREDAPEPLARERERTLQAFRERFRESGQFSDGNEEAALAWVETLGAAGHVGAARLCEKALSSEAYVEKLPRARLESLAPRNQLAAVVLIRRECEKSEPDAQALCRWFETLDEEGAHIVAAVREIHAIRGALNAVDRKVLAEEALIAARMRGHVRYAVHDGEPLVAHVVYKCGFVERAAQLGSIPAQCEVKLASGGLEAVAAWLDPMGGNWAELAAALREFRAGGGELSERDRKFLLALMAVGGLGQRELRRVRHEPLRGQLLLDFALLRVASPRAEERELGKRLQLRAAELGSGNAIAACLTADVDLACKWLEACGGDGRYARALRELCAQTGGIDPAALAGRQDILGKWMRRNQVTEAVGKALALRVGAAIEAGGDVEGAVAWYAFAYPGDARDAETAPFSPVFCRKIACAFDRREEEHGLDAPALAMAWHDRGLAAGSDLCLNRWVTACVSGDMGLSPDAAGAMRRVQAFIAPTRPAGDAELERRVRKFFAKDEMVVSQVEDTAQALDARAERCSGAEAALWREMAELLRAHAAAQQLDAQLDLAADYRDMGDIERASEILREVMAQGSVAQQANARELLAGLAVKIPPAEG